jgi:hypothetical protein
MATEVQIGESIPLGFYYTDNNGDPISGENIRLLIIDISNDAILLNNVTMSESQNVVGLYRYVWNPTFTDKVHCLAVVQVNTKGNKWPTFASKDITISDTKDDLTNTIDLNDGRAF